MLYLFFNIYLKMSKYSSNEITFFQQLLIDNDIRIDGREKMEIRKHNIQYNIIKSCLSSLKITYNNSKNEIIFAIKGEVTFLSEINKENKLINISIDSMNKLNDENTKVKNQLENLIQTLLISQIENTSLKIEKSKPEMIWKIYIDIFIFDELKISLFQLLTIGIKEALLNIKLPKIITFYNELTKNYEYDLKSNYEELTENESEYNINIIVPNVYCFAILNNLLFLDPIDEELSITNSVIFITEINQNILNIQSIGSSVDPFIYVDLGNIINTIKN